MSNTPIHVISLFMVLLPVSGKSLFSYLFLSLFLDDQFHEKQNQTVLAHFLGCSCISLLFLSWYDRYQIKFIIYFSRAAFALCFLCYFHCFRTAFTARTFCTAFTARTIRTLSLLDVLSNNCPTRTICTARRSTTSNYLVSIVICPS